MTRRKPAIVRQTHREQIRSILRLAYDDATRYVQSHGITLTHDEADDMGDECIDWLRTRLGLRVTTTDAGVECRP